MLVWEYNYEDFDKMLEIMRPFQEEREKYPDKYPKRFLPSPFKYGFRILSKTGKVIIDFNLYEVENEKQMLNYSLFWGQTVDIKWVPIVEFNIVAETLLESGYKPPT